jgi:pimeloyl-ACP methyl ester carboxylesterase
LQQLAPHLLARALHTQRRRFAQVMTPEPAGVAASGKPATSRKPAASGKPSPHVGGLAAQLAAVRAAHPLQAKAIDGHTWRYIDTGAGDRTLLLLPGALGAADTSFQYIAALGAAHRVVSVSYPATLSSLAALLDDLDTLLDRLDMAAAHVVGGSYSGLVAQYFAARRPHRVRSLLLSNTGAPGEPLAGRWRLAADIVGRLSKRRLQGAMLAGIRYFLPANSPAQAFWRSYFAGTLPHWSNQALAARLRLFAAMQSAEEARAVRRAPYTGPVLIVDAADDRLVSQRRRTALRSLYPHAQGVCFAGKGHVASLDEAAAYIRIYQEFLCHLPAPAAD